MGLASTAVCRQTIAWIPLTRREHCGCKVETKSSLHLSFSHPLSFCWLNRQRSTGRRVELTISRVTPATLHRIGWLQLDNRRPGVTARRVGAAFNGSMRSPNYPLILMLIMTMRCGSLLTGNTTGISTLAILLLNLIKKAASARALSVFTRCSWQINAPGWQYHKIQGKVEGDDKLGYLHDVLKATILVSTSIDRLDQSVLRLSFVHRSQVSSVLRTTSNMQLC